MTNQCAAEHRYDPRFESLPDDQGGTGRHKCSGCAYERGFLAGLNRQEKIDMNLQELSESQAGTVRHKSPHAAYALGYLDGISASYSQR